MTTTTTTPGSAGAGDSAVSEGSVSGVRVFASIFWRDLFVTGATLPTFLAKVVLQPFFFVFVFGKILTSLGFVQGDFVDVLIPGIIALTVFLTGLQSIALPLVIEFGWTKEIEDRLLAPLSTTMVAVEKVAFATLQALIAGALMFPISLLVIGRLPIHAERSVQLVAFLVLAAVVGSATGLVLGTVVDVRRINIVFSLVLTPLLFTGCSQYPWPSLGGLAWFQVLTLVNPLTYASEGMRSAMVPQVPHMSTAIAAAALLGITVVALAGGIAGFRHRAVD
ncbi:MAG: ABC transporter permease [Acidimicrobiales bacterium]